MALPPLIPRSVLFGNPDRMSPSLSPDGSRLGFVAPEDGVLNIWVGPADGSRPASAVTHDRDRGIRDYLFCHDDRHLVYSQDTAGDEDWRLYALDLTKGEFRLLTPETKVQAQIIAHNRWHPTTMLVALNADNPQLHDLYRLDLETGTLTLDTRNPGFASWLVDTELVPRGGFSMQADGSMTLMRRVGVIGDEWEPLLEIPADDATTTGAIGFNRAGDALFLLTSMDANATRLVRMEWSDGSRTVISEDPQYDVADVWRDPLTWEPQAVVLDESRTRVVVLDPSLENDVKRLHELGDGELGIGRQDRADRRWLVSVAPSDGPTRFHLYDRDSGDTTYLFAHKDALDDYELAPMEPFMFVSRDGLPVHGYLTFPRGEERASLPAVVNVHGGPWVRDRWGYNSEAQWLANRGYVCVQVNYRGSTGYGKAFLKAGDKQWGQAMHDDLVDAVSHVVQQGWVDGKRVGISGGSYGGYAALAGAAFTPDVFRCAIDLVGPSNLLTLLASIPDYWAPMRAMLYQRVGNLETEADMLWERSPLAHVDKIRIPVLVAQGANDPRVKQAEAEQIVAALIEKGLPHEYLLFDDEGHGLAKPANREIYYDVAERFLAQHLGGRSA
ncbi:MAG: prolyl oligopeptidase family serine peptidase [Sporichthyaceae bacterium]